MQHGAGPSSGRHFPRARNGVAKKYSKSFKNRLPVAGEVGRERPDGLLLPLPFFSWFF